ncbi:MAG: hypothetical protein M3139_11450, partial [Bacteroidota bacterium]|nr:hypothetical protein [Bacteroidota bacterium]
RITGIFVVVFDFFSPLQITLPSAPAIKISRIIRSGLYSLILLKTSFQSERAQLHTVPLRK